MTHTVDLTLLQPILARYNGRSTHNNPRSLLLPLLHEAQALYGWLPREVQQAISRTLRVPEADIHGVIEFYTMFYNEPIAKRVVRICDGSSCHVQGSDAVMAAIEDTRRIITFEDHTVLGGLGSAVADVIAASGKGCAFSKVGIPDCYCIVGYPEDLCSHYKLDTDGIIDKVREVMNMDFEEDDDWEDEV